jgi:hypothetical protein
MADERKNPMLVKFTKNATKLDTEKDIDLQHLPLSKFESPKRGKQEAINKINSVTGLSLTEGDFHQTYFQTDMMTGKKNEPVEWVCVRDGKYNNASGKWIAIMSMDDPTPNSNGPDRPHIGYRVDFNDGSDRPKRIQAGHVYVPSVPASRMSPKVRDAFKERR